MLNRRSLLLTPAAAALIPRRMYAAQIASLHGEIYRQLGIRPLINAAALIQPSPVSAGARHEKRWLRPPGVSSR